MSDINELRQVPLWLWIVIGILLLIQGAWVYRDAEKRGENKWLWGCFALLNVPSSLIIYLIVTRIMLPNSNCKSCSRKIRKDSNYCPYCGEENNI